MPTGPWAGAGGGDLPDLAAAQPGGEWHRAPSGLANHWGFTSLELDWGSPPVSFPD